MMKLILSIVFSLSFFLSFSQRVKSNGDFKNVTASETVSAPVGNFGTITGIKPTIVDNANGLGDSLFTIRVVNGDTLLQFVKIEMGNNMRVGKRGDSVLIFNTENTSATQTFYPKAGETSINSEGFSVVQSATTIGVPTARTPVINNLLSASNRIGYVGPATAGSVLYFSTATPTLWRGNAVGKGGFSATIRFALPVSAIGNSMQFYGLGANHITTSIDPSTQFNILGVGKDAADGTWQLMYNDGTGAAVKVNTGITPNITDVYEITINAIPFATSVNITFKDLSTGTSSIANISTDLPSTTQFLKFFLYLSNGTSAVSTGYDILKVYTESKY